MTEPLPLDPPPSPAEWGVRVVWLIPNKKGGARLREKTYKISALTILEALSTGHNRHLGSIITAIQAWRSPP